MLQYKEMVNDIIKNGVEIPAARENMPQTKMLNSIHSRYDFGNGFPILTGKTMPFYSITGELIGFMKGITDVRDFDELGTKVWWDNAYKWNIEDNPNFPSVTKEEYKNNRREDGTSLALASMYYELGRIYSFQWRYWTGEEHGEGLMEFDQLGNIIRSIKDKPYSRYHVITAWNPIEMNNNMVSQPNCHVYFQASCAPIVNKDRSTIQDYLRGFLTEQTVERLYSNGYNPTDMLMSHLTQRSCDMFLGVPFNITSYYLFTILLGIFTNTLPVEFEWTGVNSHIYGNHKEPMDTYIGRPQHKLPLLDIDGIYSLEDIEKISTKEQVREHFKLVNYESSGKIKGKLSVGLKEDNDEEV